MADTTRADSARTETHGPQTRRTSFNLSPEAEQMVRELAAERGVTMGEAIRRALATEKFFSEKRKEGAKVVVVEPDQKMKEIVFL